MRKRLKRNYKGTDHHGAAADYQESEQASTASSLGETPLPAGAPKLAPEEDAFEETGDDELRDQGEREEERGEMSRMESSKNSTDGFGSSVPVSPQAPSASAAASVSFGELLHEIFGFCIPWISVFSHWIGTVTLFTPEYCS
jgi:hypothetical protein